MIEVIKQLVEALEHELCIDWTNDEEFNASAEKMHDAIQAGRQAIAELESQTQAKERLRRGEEHMIEVLKQGYHCIVCGRFLPADEYGVIVHDNIEHPQEIDFGDEEKPQ